MRAKRATFNSNFRFKKYLKSFDSKLSGLWTGMNEAFSFTTRGTFYLVLQQIFNTLSLCIKSRPKQNFKMRRMLECNPVINLFSTYYSPFFSYSLKLRFLTFNPKSRPDAWLSFQADFLSKIYYFSKQKNVTTDFQHFKILRIQLKYSWPQKISFWAISKCFALHYLHIPFP